MSNLDMSERVAAEWVKLPPRVKDIVSALDEGELQYPAALSVPPEEPKNGSVGSAVKNSPRQRIKGVVTQVIAEFGQTAICGDDWYIQLPCGTYTALDRTKRGDTGVGLLRRLYEEKSGEEASNTYMSEALGHFQLYKAYRPNSVLTLQISDFNHHALYRLPDGQIYELGRQDALTIDEVADTLTLEERVIRLNLLEDFDNSPVDQREWERVLAHYDDEWWDLVTWLMLEPRKAISAITAQTSNAGKSTFVSMLAKAFPGWIANEGAGGAFKSEGRNFPELPPLLTEYRLVFLDEADKIDPAPSSSVVNALTDDVMRVRLKHVNSEQKARTGNVCFIGAGDPNIELGQGSETRFRWKVDSPNLRPLPAGLREWMLSDVGAQFACNYVLGKAITIRQMGADFRIPDRGYRAAQAFVSEARSNPLDDALRRVCVAGDARDWVSNTDIKLSIKAWDADVHVPTGRTWGATIKAAFRGAVTVTRGNPPQRGYKGLRLRTAAELDALDATYALAAD